MTDWRADVGPIHALADRIARVLEGRQLAALTSTTLAPRIGVLRDGTRLPLAPEDAAALVVPGGYDDEPDARAALVSSIGGMSPLPIVRVTAREVGREGNRLEVAVLDDPRSADRSILAVRLGGYEECWDAFDFTDAQGARDAVDVSSSLLVGEIKQVGLGRPVTATWTPMAGGTGRVEASLEERLARALLLPTTGALERSLTETAQRQAHDAWARKPIPPAGLAGTASQLLANREAALASAKGNAVVMIDLLAVLA